MYNHSNHIPQPPHSAGLSYQGLRPRIDPAQVPSPIEAIEVDRRAWESKSFTTLPGTHAPLCTSDFTAIDQGNASPKFIRMSTWNIPSSSRLASDCHIPIVAAIQPFAELDPSEDSVSVIDTGPSGPARCEQCRGYVNPWVTWVAGGNRWKCNLCSHETLVSPEYFSNLDPNMYRLDHQHRPELLKGTIDFDVTECPEYWSQNPPHRISPPYYSPSPPDPGSPRAPAPVNVLFAFDVTRTAITSGFLDSACQSLKDVLYGPNASEMCPETRVGIMTFDSTIHFYDLTSDLTPMLVVADLDEVFAPARDVFYVNPHERRNAIEALLDSIPSRFAEHISTDSCLGSAVRGALATLEGQTGHILIFQSTLPTLGAGALPHTPPPEIEFYDTDKERLLHTPRDSTWAAIADECTEQGVAVSAFLAPSQYMDVGSLNVLALHTGGSMFWHPRFLEERDGGVLKSQIGRVLGRMQGWDCTLIVRCSSGLRVKKYHGAFQPPSSPSQGIKIPTLNSDVAFTAQLEHTGTKMSSRAYAHVQCAVLYTTMAGRRRVRVVNLGMNVVELAGNVFQYADMESVIAFFAKEAMSNMPHQRTLLIREDLTEKCANILLGYRKMCAAGTKSTQLIIPEAFRALPAYTLALQKSKPLKARQVSSDVRNLHIHRILSSGLRGLMFYLYPRLLAVHDLDTTIALPQAVVMESVNANAGGEVVQEAVEKVLMPSCMRAGYFFMEPGGVYVVDNEEVMIFWVGQGVSPQILQDIWGVEDVSSLNPSLHALPRLDTILSNQIRNVVEERRRKRGVEVKMMIARQDMDASEIEFSDMLVEDQNNGAMSYVDYLALVHKQIANVLNNGGVIGGGSTSIRQSPW